MPPDLPLGGRRGKTTRVDGAPFEELTLETPGLKLAAKAWGPRDAPAVLALHGWLDNAGSFDRLAPLLPGLRIVALDLPGHGYSGHHGAGHLYAFVDLVSQAHWASVALDWSQFMVVGHSLGAAIGATLAGTFPDRVVKLALLDGLGPLTEPAATAPERLARALDEQADRVRVGRAKPRYASREEVARRLCAVNSSLSAASVQCLLQRGLRELDDGQVTWRTDRRLRLPSRLRLTEEQVLAFLGRIACPTLFVRAEHGFVLDSDFARRQLDAIDDLSVEQVPGGHHVHLDSPERVAPLLRTFLSELGRNTGTDSDRPS